MTPTHLDLFSGIGGFALAARRCGVQTIAFCENDSYAQKILIKNFGAVVADSKCVNARSRQSERSKEGQKTWMGRPKLFSDIRTLDGTQFRGVWLLTAGVPCQAASCAGKRRGPADDRWLWPEAIRVLREASPAWAIFENPPGILSLNNGVEFEHLLSEVESAGYTVQPIIIPACAVDAPHRRDRVWLVAHAGSRRRETRGNGRRATIESGALLDIERPDGDSRAMADHASQSDGLNLAGESKGQIQQSGISPQPADVPNAPGPGLEKRPGIGENSQQEFETTERGRAFGQEPYGRELESEFRGVPSRISEKLDPASLTAEWENSIEEAVGLQSVRQACSEIGYVPDALPTLQEGEEMEWVAIRIVTGNPFHSEWPNTPRVSTGIKNRADRLKCLGNAIVPQVAQQIIGWLRRAEVG